MVNGTLVTPAQQEYFDCGRQIHGLDDDRLFGNLNAMNAVFNFAGNLSYSCLIRSNGKGLMHPMNDWIPAYDEERKHWLRTLTILLNTSIPHGGAWICAYNNERVFVAIWFDRDGDVKIVLDDDRPFARMRAAGPDFIVSNCQLALNTMIEHEKELEITPNQQIKAAQGETVH